VCVLGRGDCICCVFAGSNMGRDSVTVDSKIVIRADSLEAVIQALPGDQDEDIGLEDRVAHCVADYSMLPTGRNDNGSLEFFVKDGDIDEDYDIGVLLKLARFVEDGSFYEQSDDGGITVYEVQSGKLNECLYELAEEAADGSCRGRFISERELSLQEREEADRAAREFADAAAQLFAGASPTASGELADPWDLVKCWWKLDDPEWVKRRAIEWKGVKANLRRRGWPARSLKAMQQYFLTGEDIENSEYFRWSDRFLCAPYDSPERARQFFETMHAKRDQQEMVLSNHLPFIVYLYEGLPELEQKVRDYQLGVLGPVYRPLTQVTDGEEVTLTQEPEWIVEAWCSDARRWLNCEDHEYTCAYGYFIEQVDYMFSVLEQLDHNGDPIPDELLELVNYLQLVGGVLPLTENKQAYLDRMLAEFGRKDLPASVAELLASQLESPFAAQAAISVQQQLAALIPTGIALNEAVGPEDLFQVVPRDAMESKPFAGLLVAMGHTGGKQDLPMSDALWACYPNAVYEPGVYVRMLERLQAMTGKLFDISEAEDLLDRGKSESWLRFKYAGKQVKVKLNGCVDEIHADDILFKYDQLLKKSRSGYRVYVDDMRFGMILLVGVFKKEQIEKLRKLTSIRMFNFDEFAAKYR
jgi:hypothetical protein